MKKNIAPITLVLIFSLLLVFAPDVNAQEKKITPTPQELYNEIYRQDSILFNYFNTQNFEPFKNMFTKDLEWFQHNDGLIPYKKVFENFKNIFKKSYKLNRQLVKGSLEVHPVKNYGAIQIGVHQFKHIENGKERNRHF